MKVSEDEITLKTVRDPHHDGFSEWGWDGQHLYHRSTGSKWWVRVSRVSVAKKRFLAIAELMKED